MNLICKIMLIISLTLSHSVGATARFLSLGDIHYGSENSSAEGQDTGPEFLKISLNKIKELSQQVDFILFLGDIPTHALSNAHKNEYEQVVFHGLYQSDVAAKPLFYIAGNNDSLQGNYQAFDFNGISPLSYATDWSGACAHCEGLLIDGSHMYHDAYYSSYVIPHNKDIILIALNATQWTRVPWLKRVFFSTYANQEQDALAQLAWLEQQLKNHSAKQLLIAMHEPPGKSYLGEPIWYPQYRDRFIKLLAQYQQRYGQITLLSAHTHMDEFRRIHLDNGVNIYCYATPSISRNHHNNPGMKVFSLNQDLQISNFTTYYSSYLDQWTNQQYSALGNSEAIFPHCQQESLAQCMDTLTVDQVCEAIDQGSFYGVKNPKVSNAACQKTYPVN